MEITKSASETEWSKHDSDDHDAIEFAYSKEAILLRPLDTSRQEEFKREIGKVQAVLGNIGLALRLIPYDLHNCTYN